LSSGNTGSLKFISAQGDYFEGDSNH
jgi:hypothetical protein